VNLLAAHLNRLNGPSFTRHLSLGENGNLSMGFETVSGGDSYRWDGMRRGGHARRPHWIFQYTLSGWGVFESGGSAKRVGAGQAFCARIPSRHLYRNDEACGKWTFVWLIVSHPYVVERLLKHENLVNAVVEWPATSAALRAAASLLLDCREESDPFDVENAVFHWMIEMERSAFSRRHPAGERERLMNFVRARVMDCLTAFVPVEDLAVACKMNRSNFAHHFRKTTGVSPAAFVRRIRLDEAVRLLARKNLSVKEVAAQTGFADANHLCKVFRAHMRISPGTYRRF
jgi:AraC-like DNA-binding protein